MVWAWTLKRFHGHYRHMQLAQKKGSGGGSFFSRPFLSKKKTDGYWKHDKKSPKKVATHN